MVGARRSICVQPVIDAAPLLRVALLGQLGVSRDPGGERVSIPGRAMSTLVYLLLHRGEPVSRAHLAGLLWPDFSESRGRARLRANVHALARILPLSTVPWIVADVETLSWNAAAPAWIDALEFTRLAQSPASFEDAAALYLGELAPDVTDDWLQNERDRYRRRYVEVLEKLVNSRRAQREFRAAISFAERLLDVDPWREDVVRKIMTIRHEAGDRSGAIAVYDRFAASLSEQLGTEPMPETRLLRDEIAQGAAEPMRSDFAQLDFARRSPVETLPFVGRDSEFEFLLERWNRAASGSGSIVLIAGEAGIGKSRLAQELSSFVRESGGRALRGATASPEKAPYQSLVEAIRSSGPLLSGIELAPVWMGSLAGLVPELRKRTGEIESVQLDPDRERQRLFEAIVRTLQALAKPRPLVLVLEDLHCAGEASLAALLFLARRISLSPMLIVGTFREGEVDGSHPLRTLRRELQSQGLLAQIALHELHLGDIAGVVGDASAARALHARSEGNPLFLTYLLQSGEAGGQDGWPAPLRELVLRQLDRVDSQARSVAEIGALVGSEFSSEIVEEVTGWNAASVARAFDALIERRILSEPATFDRFEYVFAHEYVRNTIAQAIPDRRAKHRHARIALVLERLFPDRKSELAASIARHYEQANDAPSASRAYLAAGQHADKLGAYDSALSHFERGLALATDLELRSRLLLELEALQSLRGARSLQRAVLDELGALAERLGDDALRQQAAYRRFRLARALGDVKEQTLQLDALRNYTAALGTVSAVRSLHLAETEYYKELGRFDEALEAARKALEVCAEPAARSERIEALCAIAHVEAARGDFAQSAQTLEDAARIADSPADRRRVLEQQAARAIHADDIAGLQNIGSELVEANSAAGDRKGEAAALTWMGIAMLRLDRYADAIGCFDRAETIGIEIDDRRRVANVLVNSAHLDMTLGALPKALHKLERALPLHENERYLYGTFSCICNMSAIHAYLGNAGRAREYSIRAIALAREGKSSAYEATALENLAEAEAAAGRYAVAIEVMETAITKRRELGTPLSVAWCLANLAIWYARCGDLQSARERIAMMLASEDQIRTGNPWPQFCYWAAAQVYRLCRDDSNYATMLEKAYDLLMAQADDCPSAEYRESLLDLPWHRDIASARERVK